MKKVKTTGKFSITFAFFILLVFSLTAFSQTPTPTPTPSEDENDTVKISTTLIQIDVTVTDKDNNVVTDLKPGDLEIYENGQKQEITNFSFIRRGTEDKLSAVKTEKPQPTVGKLVVAAPSVKLKADQVQRTYTLVVDDLGLSFGNVFFVKQSLKKFINEQMGVGDLVAIILTGKTNGALSSFTSNKNQLLRVVDKIKWNSVGRSGISTFESIDTTDEVKKSEMERIKPLRDDNFAVGTLGTVSRVLSGMRDLPGRKAVILFSEGFVIQKIGSPEDKFSKMKGETKAKDLMKSIADLANRASVVIYTIDPRGLQNSQMAEAQDNIAEVRGQKNPGTGNKPGDIARARRNDEFTQSQDVLRFLAEETGGLAFINQNNINKGLQRAVIDQSSYYLLGYVPDEKTFNPNTSKFNKLEIKAVRPGLKLRYRSGFFGVTDQKYKEEQKARESNVAAALSSPFGANDITLDLTSIYANTANEGNIVQALLNIDAKDLSFTDIPNGGKQTEFELYAFAFGENGRILNSISKTYSIKVNQEVYRNMTERGFVYFMNIPFSKPGAYQLRVALKDIKTQKIGAANQYIEVPNLEKNKLTLSGLILQAFTNEEWNSQDISAIQIDKNKSLTTAGIRKFKQGSVMQINYGVYNAKNTASNSYKSQIRLYRDGQLVYEGKQMPLRLAGNDGKRAEGQGALALGKELVPGDYVLQTIVFDESAKNKNQLASQSIDFEITN